MAPRPLRKEQLEAIAKITVDGTNTRGTGFLVTAKGHVLTAFHVVGDLATKKPESRTIRLRFGDPKSPPTHETTAKVGVFGAGNGEDWALLECDAPIPKAAPIPLATLWPYDVEWSTFGFPNSSPDSGLPVGGSIRAYNAGSIRLFGEEVGAAKLAIDGLSGAPVIVGGAAVGIVTNALGREDNGVLFAQPILRCAERTKDLPWPDARKLPFTAEIATNIKHAFDLLAEHAPKLGIANAEQMNEDQLSRTVARLMLLGGVHTAQFALSLIIAERLEKADSDERILRWVSSMWIPDPAVTQLETFVRSTDPARVAAAVNVQHPETCRHYLRRAAYPYRAIPGWRLCEATGAWSENDLEDALDEVSKELARHFSCEDDDLDVRITKIKAELAQLSGDDPRIMLIAGTPHSTVLAELWKRFEPVRFLVLSGALTADVVKSEFPGVVFIEPAIESGREDLAKKHYKDAVRELADARKDAKES